MQYNSITVTIQELVNEVYQTARDKGWYQSERAPLEFHMLMVSEIAEATECARRDEPAVYFNDHNSQRPWDGSVSAQGKPEGEAVELVDAMIRIADYFGYKGWDLEKVLRLKMNYNQTRSFRHGGKKY